MWSSNTLSISLSRRVSSIVRGHAVGATNSTPSASFLGERLVCGAVICLRRLRRCCYQHGCDSSFGAARFSMVSMAPGARMEIASAAMMDLKAMAPVLIWSKLESKLLVLQRPSYEHSSKIWLGSMLLMATGDDRPDDAMVKIELMTCQLGALDDSDEWWRRWMASMVGFDGWRRWLASMVDWGLRHRWKYLCVPSGEGDTHNVACSLSEQFAGCLVGAARSMPCGSAPSSVENDFE